MHPPSRLVGANRPPRPRRRSPRRDSSRLSPTTIPSSARTPLWSWLGGRKARSSTDSDARTRPERVSSARTCSSARKADPSRQLPPACDPADWRPPVPSDRRPERSEEHTSELQSRLHLVCRLLLEKKKKKQHTIQ